MLRYNDPNHPQRSFLIQITRHFGGARQYFTFRILDGVPGRTSSEPYRHYLDCARAALEAARSICRQPPH